MPRSEIHILLHVLVPLAAAWLFFPNNQRTKAFLILMLALVIDLDHLLATPIYAPNRCSIGFHPLHTLPAMVGYVILLAPAKTRLFALGLLIHIGLDSIDCAWMRWLG